MRFEFSNLTGPRSSGIQDGGPARVGPAIGRHIPESAGAQGGSTFADTLREALGEVAGLQTEAQDTIGAFLRGEPVETHRVMAAAEEAGIALEMLIEIRNKITEAYRAVMQMQT
ncbi:MAG: flagellar hook-basal body complex protein FliE [Gemmatimonadota bacterium]|nr:flagellar hook-basal body complex protein FliE [Gemmatimonadota bacterium]